MAVDLSGLTGYVDENRLPLIKKVTLTAPSLKLFNIQTGVKQPTAINILTVDTTFGDCACGWDPAGKQELTQRMINPGCIKINDSICDLDMLKFWTGYHVRVAAGKESLGTFEADFVEGIVGDVVRKLDIALYKGDTDSSDPNLNKFDGLLKILRADMPASNILAPVSGESAYEALLRVHAALPGEALRRGNVAILVGSDVFRKALAELTAITLACKPETIGEDGNSKQNGVDFFYLPGSKTRVFAVEGLDGTNQVLAGSLENFFYGTDLENDYEAIDFWYSKDNQEWRYAIKFISGVQVAFPDEIILSSIA
ncbi:MAG: hypothetical protein LUG98_09980 [Tannerellaceae bacterium]|nr:hypothetical protein [Tannerellaceae bacterium]